MIIENLIQGADAVAFKKYRCLVCDFIYDEELGWEEDDIAPGTLWEDVPEDWYCPDCGIGKEDFELMTDELKKSL